jgi:protein-L-isoaspartate(D-aspartate) O-methyltransferase
MADKDFSVERQRMVVGQLKSRGIHDPRVLEALYEVPRHLFCPENDRTWAYGDHPQPIGFNQTISQPYVVALMTERLQLTGTERVLEVGTGSGYQAAILSILAAEVHTIEIIPELAESSRGPIELLKISNVHFHVGDGSLGLPEAAPYDGIIVTAAAPEVPRPLLDQLNDGGRLILPVGSRGYQQLELWQRNGNSYNSHVIIPVAFVPLQGKFGWDKID